MAATKTGPKKATTATATKTSTKGRTAGKQPATATKQGRKPTTPAPSARNLAAELDTLFVWLERNKDIYTFGGFARRAGLTAVELTRLKTKASGWAALLTEANVDALITAAVSVEPFKPRAR